jgi:di/tricarboxylate transporter
MASFDLFSVTPIGLALLAAGVGYFALLGRRVLPARRGGAPDPGLTAGYFEQIYGIKGDIFEARVPLGSPLVGMTVGEVESDPEAPFILGIFDGEELRIEPHMAVPIPVGAVFAVMGTEQQVRAFRRAQKLDLRGELNTFLEALNPSRAGIAEMVVPPGSTLIGKTLVDVQMRRRYGINVLAVYRQEVVLRKKDVRTLPLQAGDTLVAHARWGDFHQLARDAGVVLVTDVPREVVRPHKVAHALTFFLLALGLVLFTDLRLALALLVGAVGMILSGVLTIDEAYRSVGWQTVFLLACLLPLGVTVETTGTAAWIAQESLRLLGNVPPWVVQALLALLASAFTLVMSNVGATVLLVPIAVNMAIGAGADPAMFALTVALATSNSFIIPTHQVNALIMGPASYRVADFMRAGWPLSVIFLVVLIVMLNLLF